MKTVFNNILFGALFLTLNATCISQNNNPFKDKIVIVLDIQDHFTNNLGDSASLQLINSINSVIDNSDQANVVYIKSVLSTLYISLKGFEVDTLQNLELDERLNVFNYNIFWKSKANAFTSEELVKFIDMRDINDIVIVGLMAEHCVYKTSIGAKKLGYNVYIAPNAIIGKSEKSKRKRIKRLVKKGIEII